MDHSDICAINFGYNSFAEYDVLMEMEKLAHSGQQINIKMERDKESNREKHQKQKEKIMKKIMQLKKKYIKLETSDRSIKVAYVVFRSMEGKRRF